MSSRLVLVSPNLVLNTDYITKIWFNPETFNVVITYLDGSQMDNGIVVPRTHIHNLGEMSFATYLRELGMLS